MVVSALERVKGMVAGKIRPSTMRYIKKEAKVVAILIATHLAYQSGRKVWSLLTGRKKPPAQNRLAATIRDEVVTASISTLVGKLFDNDDDEQSSMTQLIYSHVGDFDDAGAPYVKWQGLLFCCMFRKFWECSNAKLIKVYSDDMKNEPEMLPINTGEETVSAWKNCIVKGAWDGVPVVAHLRDEDGGGRIMFFAGNVHAKSIRDAFLKFVYEKNFMKNKIVGNDGRIMRPESLPVWDDVVLPDSVKDRVMLNTVGFLGKSDDLKDRGVRFSRGNLWVGKPGTGKTTVAKIIARLSRGTTCLFIPSPGLDSDGIRDVFRMARALSPVIVFLEDLDRAANSAKNALIGELDGTECNDGVIVVASVNDVFALSVALRDRPNRFDSVVEFPLPTQKERFDLFELYAKKYNVPTTDNVLSDLAADSEGLSPAHCEEVVESAVILDVAGVGGMESCDSRGLLMDCLASVKSQHEKNVPDRVG